METTVEISQKQREFPFVGFLPKQEAGWLYSTPVSKKAYSEPIREEFSEAVDGRIVRRWRDHINESFKYETFPGYLDIKLVGVIVPAKEIKKMLEKERLLAGDDADIFVENIRSAFLLHRHDIKETLREEVAGKVVELHPLIAYLTIEQDTDIINTITYTTDLLFAEKKDKIRDFIAKHREDLMTIKVVRKFKVYRE